MYVLDSSALIEVFDRSKFGDTIVQLLQDEPAVTTSICMHEVLVGALSDKQRFIFMSLFSSMIVLEHTTAAALAGSRIEQELARVGHKINANDVLIAGICKANDATIVTLDKDFARIKELKSKIIS